jgi:uncharacterized protein YcgL (UPF0745 family)
MSDEQIEQLAMALQVTTAAGRLNLAETRQVLRKLEEMGFTYQAPAKADGQ